MHATDSPTRNVRARWAAIGAAVAVSLGAGGLGIARATSPEGASAYVPITPCRIMDTRPGDAQVGTQVGALVGPDAEITVDGWGDVAGDCDLPSGTTGLQLNVTAVDASELTNLRFYPEGSDTPTASNLNPAPGEPPTPNAVAVALNAASGKFHVFNRFGSVDVVLDVQGYFTDHEHDDRYYPRAEADAALAAATDSLSVDTQTALDAAIDSLSVTTQTALDAAIATRVPRQQTVFIPASAFGPRTKDEPFHRTPLLAWIDDAGYLDAPLTLPVGSHIVRMTATFYDNSAADLSVAIVRTYLGSSPSISIVEGISTSGASTGARTASVSPSPAIEIGDNQTHSLEVYSGGWTNAIQLYAVQIDYTLPETPSVPPILPPISTLPPVVSP